MVPLLLLLGGCAPNAAGGADDRAARAGIVMLRERDGGATDMARRVVGGALRPDQAGAVIDVLVAEGDRYAGRIVLRITERVEGLTGGTVDVVRCYRYTLNNSIDDHQPERIGCPKLPPLVLPPPTPRPTLPAGIDDALPDALGRLDRDQRTEQGVLDAARSVAGPVRVLQVTTVDGTIGLAVGNGDDECVFATVSGNGIEVWRVPRVVAQPGELGCSADAAARGQGKTSPH